MSRCHSPSIEYVSVHACVYVHIYATCVIYNIYVCIFEFNFEYVKSTFQNSNLYKVIIEKVLLPLYPTQVIYSVLQM